MSVPVSVGPGIGPVNHGRFRQGGVFLPGKKGGPTNLFVTIVVAILVSAVCNQTGWSSGPRPSSDDDEVTMRPDEEGIWGEVEDDST